MRLPKATVTVKELPLRERRKGTPSPGLWRATTAYSAATDSVGWPTTLVMTSQPATVVAGRETLSGASAAASPGRGGDPQFFSGAQGAVAVARERVVAHGVLSWPDKATICGRASISPAHPRRRVR